MKKNILIIVILFFTNFAYAQSDFGLKLTINDSILKFNSKKQEAIVVNMSLEFANDVDSIVLYNFGQYVIPMDFGFDDPSYDYILENNRLSFIIEDEKGNFIKPSSVLDIFISYVSPKGVFVSLNSRYIVKEGNLEVVRKFFDPNITEEYCELFRYDHSKHLITKHKQNIILYPMLYGLRPSFQGKLSKGEYYLYFVYNVTGYPANSLHEREKECGIDVWENEKQFVGTIRSNKVKLIVEEEKSMTKREKRIFRKNKERKRKH
ncbi:hypothetical protein LJC25_00510 [Bacteroidales bacterium OttesenSCG-928-K03]|nr:hypothetical protein [Odoribacter sp. OttesenSCG-928-L07]MDL2241009.1 hypothetical protein [Bacteroidales bacterium OttesenSCG-928-K22]MDL2242194.1 hypothetical protein [Bacteroidales bacterium OttesenSCG-928-K03]